MNQNELLVQLIQRLLSFLPAGNMLSSLVSAPVANWLSPESSMANTFMWPGQGQTMNMVATNFMDRMLQQSFNSTANKFSKEQEIRALTEYHRMLNPDKSDEELLGLAQNSAKNFFDVGNILYNTLDPYKLKVGLSRAGGVASILHMREESIGLKGAEYARSVSQGIMGNHENSLVRDIIDNPSLYGNMSVADAMAVGREIALTDRSGFKKADGTFDSDRFKNRVKEVSRALEPWKDIFGKDVPELLNQLEALTGTSIGASSSADIQSLGNRMTAILGATGAKVQHIAAYRDALANNLVDPTMTSRSILGAAAIAGDMTLGMANLSVSHLTNSQMQQLVGKIYSGTGSSKFTDRYALAYARWANSKNDEELNPDEFREQVMARIAAGDSNTEALLSVSGASSLSELGAYRDTERYLNMIKTGRANQVNMDVTDVKARNSAMAFYTSENYGSNFSQKAKDYLQGLSREEYIKFMAMDRDDKEGVLASMAIDGDRRQIVAAIESSAAAGMSSVRGIDFNAGTVRGVYQERENYLKNEALAKEREKFNTAVSRFTITGGLSQILNNMRESKGDISKMFRDYTGGSDMLRVMLETELGANTSFDGEDGKKIEQMYMQGLNFARNNYSELGSGGAFNSVYKLMMNKGNIEDVRKGYRIAAELNALGQGALSKMTDEDQAGLLEALNRAQLSDDPKARGRFAKNFYMDRTVLSTYNSLQKEGKFTGDDANLQTHATSLLQLMSSGTHASIEELKKQFITTDLKDKDKQDREKVFRMMTANVGDIDGIDPLQTIAKFLADLPSALERLITALNNNGNKPKGGT